MDIAAQYQMGFAIHSVVIGNSVACGFNGDGWKDLPQILQYNGKLKPEFRESDIPQSAPTKLRAFLKARNPASTVVNLCGSGWDTNDHLGIHTSKSGVAGPTNTIDDIRALRPRPSVAFIPLQINDVTHGLSVQTFTINTNRIITELTALGIVPVLVKENYARLPAYPEYIAKTDDIARVRKLAVIDTYAPFVGSSVLLSDYAHPINKGHDLMFGEYRKWFSFYRAPNLPPMVQPKQKSTLFSKLTSWVTKKIN